MTCTAYCVKIEEIFDAMIRLSYKVLPENQPVINNYVDGAWKLVTKFIQSIGREEGTEELRSKFESYVAAEESRLEQSFKDINYLIDSPNVVQVISGKGSVRNMVFFELFPCYFSPLSMLFYPPLRSFLSVSLFKEKTKTRAID